MFKAADDAANELSYFDSKSKIQQNKDSIVRIYSKKELSNR